MYQQAAKDKEVMKLSQLSIYCGFVNKYKTLLQLCSVMLAVLRALGWWWLVVIHVHSLLSVLGMRSSHTLSRHSVPVLHPQFTTIVSIFCYWWTTDSPTTKCLEKVTIILTNTEGNCPIADISYNISEHFF